MKKILFVVLGILVIVMMVTVFSKPKSGPKGSARRSGKTAGEIKTKSKEQIAAERRKARMEERARKRELKKRLREERRAQRLANRYGYRYGYGYSTRRRVRGMSRRGTIGAARTRRGGVAQIYKLRAILNVDNIKFALIDNRQYKVGDEIMGRKIVEILDDRIVVLENNVRREVKVGEIAFPNLITRSRRSK